MATVLIVCGLAAKAVLLRTFKIVAILSAEDVGATITVVRWVVDALRASHTAMKHMSALAEAASPPGRAADATAEVDWPWIVSLRVCVSKPKAKDRG